MSAALQAYIDGGARGNPGPAGYGVLIQDESENVIHEEARFIGVQTNNYAEYRALIYALQYAVDNGVESFRVYSDSELLVRQINGQYKVKAPNLKPVFAEASSLVARIPNFRISHIPRRKNHLADKLANKAMDQSDLDPTGA